MSKGLRHENPSARPAPMHGPARQVVTLFDVVLTGHSLPAVPSQHTAVQLARLLRIPARDALNLLGGRPSIVRARLPLAPALRYQLAFQRVGAECQVMPAAANEAWESRASDQSPESPRETKNATDKQPAPLTQSTPVSETRPAASPLPTSSTPTWWIPDALPLPQPTLAEEGGAALTAVWGVGWILLLYGAGIVALAGTTLWHGWQHAHWLNAGIPYIFPITYFALLSGGGALLLVLLRPLLTTPCENACGTPLSAKQSPALYDLAQRIANAVGSPNPVTIHLTWHTTVKTVTDARVDAPILIIGLPVLASLSLEELTVTMVRALAPLNTTYRSKLHYIATEMETFLRHAARGPDSWDSLLEAQLIGSRDGHTLSVLLATWLLRSSRMIFLPGLKLARFAGHRIRATESAKRDALAARFTGEAAVTSASLKLSLLRNAEALTSQAALNLGFKAEPVRDLPRMIVEQAVRSGRLHRPEQAASILVDNLAALSIAATKDFYAAAGTLRDHATDRPATR